MTGAQQLTEQVRRESKAESVLQVLNARGIALSEAQGAKVLATMDIPLLERWLRAAAVCSTSDEVFG